MQKNVTIELIGKQNYPEGHDDQQELLVSGKLYKSSGVFYIYYKEAEAKTTDLGEVTTLLTIEGEIITLTRKGAVNVKQEFKVGVLNRSKYTTCYGDILMSIMPRRVESDLTGSGGRISLEYDLFVDDKLVSYNVLSLNVKEDIPQ